MTSQLDDLGSTEGLTPEREKELNIALNEISGEWDELKLTEDCASKRRIDPSLTHRSIGARVTSPAGRRPTLSTAQSCDFILDATPPTW